MTYPGDPIVTQSPRFTGSYLVTVGGDAIVDVVRRAMDHHSGLGFVELTERGAIIVGRTRLLPRTTAILEFHSKPPAGTLISARRPAFVWSGFEGLMRAVLRCIKEEVDRIVAEGRPF